MNIHSERAHALLSASGSERWMICTPSPREEEKLPETTSVYAEEGTCAHELSEYRLEERLGLTQDPKVLERVQASEYYSDSMEDYVDGYCDIIMERYSEALAMDPDAKIFIEQRMDYSHWVPEGFGTGDVLIIGNGLLQIIDLKYGKGVPKDAEWNSQLMLYALGGIRKYEMLYEFTKVRMTIIQPRLDSVSDWEVMADKLINWAETEVVHKASLAWEGAGDYVAGDHCQFCKVAPTCRALAEYNLKLARLEFAPPNTLSEEEIGQILQQAMMLTKWVSKVTEYANDQAINKGVTFKGWKLVEGKSNRKITDPKAVQMALDIEGYDIDEVSPRKLNGITALEKLVGKKHLQELVGSYIIKPEGKPTLVPESDKREAIKTKLTASEEFSALE